MMLKKIDRMHSLFGQNAGHRCRECSNYMRYQHHDRSVRKCSVYGNTRSEASDWNGSYTACGMFNRDYMGRNVIEIQTEDDARRVPLSGQQSFFD